MYNKYLFTGIITAKLLWQLKNNQKKPIKKLRSIQLKNIKSIVNFAYNYVPYYHNMFKSNNIHPTDIESLRDLQKIPITTKNDVRNNYLNMIAKGINKSNCIEYFTSGSTGIPLKTYKDLVGYSKDSALKAYIFLECGIRLSDKFVTIALSPKSIRFPNQLFISYKKSIGTILNDLRLIKPDVIYTLPTILEDICFNDTSGINPRHIFTQACKLTKRCRNLVRSTFNLEVNDTYGSTELGILAFECNEHSGLHMITDSAVIEFLDDDGEPVTNGEVGEIVTTGLFNYAMPMIRYKLGDFGIPIEDGCSCGRSWPLIKNIEGRIIDTFVMPSGKKIYPRYLYLCIDHAINNNLFTISQYQIIQEEKNKIIFKIVKGKNYNPNIKYEIINNVKKLCNKTDENITVKVMIVDKIKEKSGKRKLIKSLVK